ncbi:MAG: 23S rRNA (uracil(1939)-C(5))-methyltransferase RlmD [Acetatifactor sp.]|nr:23S rRNA (uracil(1939)-C(5))-methyltransferase RlmD [Acetatifactor sp.]
MKENNEQRRRNKHTSKQADSDGYKGNDLIGDKAGNIPCSVAKRCGGCQWIGMDYQEQLKEKEKQVRKLLAPYCKLEGILGMEQPLHYRNKVHAAFGENKKHQLISGIYEERTHRIVPVDSCLIENQQADAIIVSIRELLLSFKIRPYNEDTGYGLLRHVLVRTGQTSGQILVVLVLTSPILPSKNNFVKALLKRHPEITTIVVNVNNRSTSMVLGDREQVIYGKGYIEDTLCGRIFRISPKSFYQINPVQTEVLYAKAMEYAALTGQETVVDAYCGIGTIGIIASAQAKQVIGVELNADAVRDARNNAKINQARNIQFYQNDAGRFLLEMEEQGAQVDVVLMDPPRSGSSEEFLSAVAHMAPGRVVYVSCNPETLVRDLKYMVRNGYRAERAVAVDMFPFTGHVEVACCLQRKDS